MNPCKHVNIIGQCGHWYFLRYYQFCNLEIPKPTSYAHHRILYILYLSPYLGLCFGQPNYVVAQRPSNADYGFLVNQKSDFLLPLYMLLIGHTLVKQTKVFPVKILLILRVEKNCLWFRKQNLDVPMIPRNFNLVLQKLNTLLTKDGKIY